MSEQWLSIVEYARLNSLSDMTVRRRIKTGRLHAVLREGKYYIQQPCQRTRVLQRSPLRTPKTHETNQTVSASNTKSLYLEQTGREPESIKLPNQRYSFGHQSPAPQPTSAESSSATESVIREIRDLSEIVQQALTQLEEKQTAVRNESQQAKVVLEKKIALLEEKLTVEQLKTEKVHQQNEDLRTLLKIMEKAHYSQSKEPSP